MRVEVDLSVKAQKLQKLMMREELKRVLKHEDEWISTREAARILRISEDRLRRIRDRFVCMRVGDEDGKGRLLWHRESLIEAYVTGRK